MIDAYDWAGGQEALLRFGPAHGPVVVAVQPLLEEWNRTRAFTVTLLRALADRGVAGVLPDLPGHGESLATVADQTIATLAAAVEGAVAGEQARGRATVGIAMRSGALVDHSPLHRARWQLSPVTGEDLLADLRRTWLAGCEAGDRSFDAMLAGVTVAGTPLSAGFLRSLASGAADAPAVPLRVVRLESDPREADRKVAGPPLWRRAEPGNDGALAGALADDIADWIATCAVS